MAEFERIGVFCIALLSEIGYIQIITSGRAVGDPMEQEYAEAQTWKQQS
jgi:hypothetical protein